MVNQPSQTTNSDTIKIRTSVNNQQPIFNTTTLTAHNLFNYPDQQDLCYSRLETNNRPNMIYSDMSEGKVFRGFLPLESELQPDTQTTIRVIGEELNTPVIDYTRPEFNLYTNPRSNDTLKQQSTGLMLNNNNSHTINNNNNSTVNQSSIINAADEWTSDNFTDYQSLLFSPDSTKSTNSPSGLNSSDLTEESFIFETTACDTNLPVKYSQDYEDFGFVDEIDQISKLKEFNTDDYPRTFDNDDDNETDCKSANNLVARAVLYQDTMITGLAQPPTTMLLDEDSYLVTVDNFDDLMIKPERKFVDEHVSNVNVASDNIQVVCVQNISDYIILTPAPSPKSPTSVTQKCGTDTDDCENSSDCFPVNDMNKALSPVAEDRLHLEHNYNLNNPNNIDETSSCKRKLVTDRSPTRQQEKRTRRVQSLKLKIPTMRVLRQDSNKIDVNTPDITNDILEMEDEKFDLISYLISPSQDKPIVDLTDVKPATTIPIPTKPASPLDLETIINEQCPIPTKRRRLNSYDNPGSVQSVTSTILSDDSSRPAPKRRGRPPKTGSTLPSPSQYRHLNESDWKYVEMRNKNNEASRRSRINRKDREHQIESEATELEMEYNTLVDEEKALEKQVAKWRQAVMKLALI